MNKIQDKIKILRS